MRGTEVNIIGLLHPAAIVRGQWGKEPFQQATVDRVFRCLRGQQEPPTWNVELPPPGANLFPSREALKSFYQDFLDEKYDAVSCDLENAGPHVITFCFTQLNLSTGALGKTIVPRVRRRGGRMYHTSQYEFLEMIYWVDKLLGDSRITKVFHNGVTHDVPILEEIGFRVEGPLVDTMTLVHLCWPEGPKGLQYAATRYLWLPVWKHLVDAEDEDEGKA